MKTERDTKIRKPPHPSERVRYYIFEKKEAGHNGSELNSVTGGGLRALYPYPQLQVGHRRPTLRDHAMICFDQTAPGLFCIVQARCVEQP
jgi:hypothetical protein